MSFKRSGGFPLDLRPRSVSSIYLPGDTVIFDLFWGNMDTAVATPTALPFPCNTTPASSNPMPSTAEFPNSWLGTPGNDPCSASTTTTRRRALSTSVVRNDGMNALRLWPRSLDHCRHRR
ncbi:MAG: hypothetical protein R3B47_05245 [Bacteroidia bacterium]